MADPVTELKHDFSALRQDVRGLADKLDAHHTDIAVLKEANQRDNAYLHETKHTLVQHIARVEGTTMKAMADMDGRHTKTNDILFKKIDDLTTAVKEQTKADTEDRKSAARKAIYWLLGVILILIGAVWKAYVG